MRIKESAGEGYFLLGVSNRRVSVARRQGDGFIDVHSRSSRMFDRRLDQTTNEIESIEL